MLDGAFTIFWGNLLNGKNITRFNQNKHYSARSFCSGRINKYHKIIIQNIVLTISDDVYL